MRGRAPTVLDALLVSSVVLAMVVGITLFAWQAIEAVVGYILIMALVGVGTSCYQWFVAYRYSSAEAEYRERRRKTEEANRRR